jgi:hypothetical protein
VIGVEPAHGAGDGVPVGCGLACVGDGGTGIDLHGPAELPRALPEPLSEKLAADVDQDPTEPGVETGRIAQAAAISPGKGEGVLRRVVRVARVAENRPDEAVRRVEMPSVSAANTSSPDSLASDSLRKIAAPPTARTMPDTIAGGRVFVHANSGDA